MDRGSLASFGEKFTGSDGRVSFSSEKDPFHTNLGPGPILPLRRKDTESDILAKMYRFMRTEYEIEKKQDKKELKIRKDAEKERDNRTAELISLFGGKYNSKTGKGTKKFGKTAMMFGVGGAALLFSSDVMAKIQSLTDLISDYGGPFTTKTGTSETPVDMNANELTARMSASRYLGLAEGELISQQEWNSLVRATHAEAGPRTNVNEMAMIMGSILNRVRSHHLGGQSIEEILQQPSQFQSVTGTSQKPGPSERYTEGPSDGERKEAVYTAAGMLPRVSKEQMGFAAESEQAYGPGTSKEYREQLKRKPTTSVEGGTRFETSLSQISAKIENLSGLNLNSPVRSQRISDKGIFNAIRERGGQFHHFHQGVDYMGNIGDPVYASNSGTVEVREQPEYAGKYIVVKGDDGIITKYMHLDSFLVRDGQRVNKGDEIAKLGDSGSAKGQPHLHFEVWKNSTPVDPEKVIPKQFSSLVNSKNTLAELNIPKLSKPVNAKSPIVMVNNNNIVTKSGDTTMAESVGDDSSYHSVFMSKQFS